MTTMPVERRRNLWLELFILGELMDAPHHGYQLRDILTRMLGPYRRISWATLYPLIYQREQAGFIAASHESGGERPPSEEGPTQGETAPNMRRPQRYRLTESGRERFFALLRAQDAYTSEYREVFTIKLLYLHFLEPDQQRALLTHGREYFVRQRDHTRHVFTAASTTAHLSPEEREPIFRMNRFRLTSVEAEIRWIDEELARLESVQSS